jgi:primosomal protein N' (replication factor Y)
VYKRQEKGVFEIYSEQIERVQLENFQQDLNSLTQVQQVAFDQITENFEKDKIILLHGITSSGKTEIYSKLIDEQIKQGKQVLYLLPEIALTTHINRRLQKYFS